MAEYTQERINYMQSDENEWLEAGEDTEQEDEMAEQKQKQLNRELERYIASLESELAAQPRMVESVLIVFLSVALALIALISAFIEAFATAPTVVAFASYLSVVLMVVFAIMSLSLAVYFLIPISRVNTEKKRLSAELRKAKDSR